MTHVRYGIAVLSVTAVLALGGCQGAGGTGLVAKSPDDVVKAAWMAANAGQYSQADKHLSSKVLEAMKGGLGALAGGTKGVWDQRTRNGTISKIEILKEETRGEGAKVYFRVHFKDGSTRTVTRDSSRRTVRGRSLFSRRKNPVWPLNELTKHLL